MGLYLRLGRGRRRRQRHWRLIPQNLQEPSPIGDGSSGCRKSRRLFSTACNNAGIFVPRSGTKILASLHARLAEQGLARHLIRFEAGFAPSSSPCEEERLHARQGFIDTQKSHPRPGMALLAKPLPMGISTTQESHIGIPQSSCHYERRGKIRTKEQAKSHVQCEMPLFPAGFFLMPCTLPRCIFRARRVNTTHVNFALNGGISYMKATGIVRRIDD